MKQFTQLRIGVFDDHALLLRGMSSVIGQQDGFEVAFTCSDQAQLEAKIATERPDVVVLDVVAPGVLGLDLFKRIVTAFPALGIIAHTSLDSAILVQNLLAIGVRGYVSKRADESVLLQAIACVGNGQPWVPEEYRFLLAQRERARSAVSLSERENQVLLLVLQGLLSKEIADRLGIAHNTVRNHRANLFEKFRVENMGELMREATRLGYNS